MDADELQAYALSLPGAWPDQPWEGDPVAKVGSSPGKIFAFPRAEHVALKVAPEDGAELRQAYPDAVGDAPYLSKRHWVRIRLDGTVPDEELRDLVDGSHALVVAGLPRAQRPYLAARPDR